MATDKVTAANRKIAKASAKQKIPAAGLGSFDTPSFAKGLNPRQLFQAALNQNFITQAEFDDFDKRLGKDASAVEEFNKKVPNKLKYVKQQPELKGIMQAAGFTSETKVNKPERIKLITLADKTLKEVENMGGSRADKIRAFADKFISDATPMIKNPGAVINFARRFITTVFFGPSTFLGESLATDPEFQEQLLSDPTISSFFGAESEPMAFQEGGIATINSMIRPLGYKNAGEVGIREAILKALENRNLVDEGFFISPDDIYKNKGMSDEEIKKQKEINKIMTDRFTKDPYEGMSDEKKQELKRIRRIQRLIREKQRKEMGLPDFIQLLGSN